MRPRSERREVPASHGLQSRRSGTSRGMTERSPRDPPFHELHELLGLLAAGETRSKALSAVLGISVRTVRSRLRLLQTWGLVKSAQRAREDRWQLTGAGQRASVPSTVRRLDVVDTHSRPPSLPSRSGDAVTDWTWSTPGDSGMDDEQAAVTAAPGSRTSGTSRSRQCRCRPAPRRRASG